MLWVNTIFIHAMGVKINATGELKLNDRTGQRGSEKNEERIETK